MKGLCTCNNKRRGKLYCFKSIF